MDGACPALIARYFWLSGPRRHLIASNARSGCLLYELTAMLEPPIVVTAGVEASMAGYGAHATFFARSGASDCMDAQTYGQFTWNAPPPLWNARRTSSSIALQNDGLVTPEVASFFMTSSALTVPLSITAVLPSSLTTWPPALATRLLKRTTRPSYWAPIVRI